MLHKPVTVLLLLFIFFIHMKKYVNCIICAFTLHIATNVQILCWSKTSPLFSGARSSCISRSINTKSACTSGSICRERISFISIFGAIVNISQYKNSMSGFSNSPCRCMQVNILLSSFLKVYFWFIPLIFIVCIYTITTLNIVHTNGHFSHTCVLSCPMINLELWGCNTIGFKIKIKCQLWV